MKNENVWLSLKQIFHIYIFKFILKYDIKILNDIARIVDKI